MRRSSLYLYLMMAAVIFLAACSPAPKPEAITNAVPEPTIEGVWTHEETEQIGGPSAGKITSPQPSLVFITKNYYSTMFVSGGQPRPLYKALPPTDKEIVAAYHGFIGVAGPYELKGSTIVLRPSVSIEPNLMSGASVELDYKLEGDTLLLAVDPKKIVYSSVENRPDYTEGRYKLKRLE